MGGVRNGAAEKDWCWDLNPGVTAMLGFLELCSFRVCPFLPRGLGSRRDLARKKRGERTLVGGP